MKVALIQINCIVGDFAGNCEKIRLGAEQAAAAGCRLAVFPEMSVSGYPPQDLLERESFLKAQDAALDQLALQLPNIDVMLGCIYTKYGEPRRLYNCAAVYRRGVVVHRSTKKLLPTYDVFDEARWFTTDTQTSLYEVDGLSFGVTVCEDIWAEEMPGYDVNPVNDILACASEEGCHLSGIINISASPFTRGKYIQRLAILDRFRFVHNLPFFYCNQVGGQDSLIFDGRSVVMTANGEIAARAKGFAEDMVVYNTETGEGELHETVERTQTSAMWDALVLGVKDYAGKNGFTSAVLGLSGGIDSALTAVLAVEAFGAENVLTVAMPSPYSSQGSMDDARALAQNLGVHFEVQPIGDLFAAFNTQLAGLFAGREEDVTEQNLQARIRGNLLMAISNKFGHLLLTTGNKSEIAVGYCTLYGDMCGGLGVISDLLKGDVYELSRYANRGGEVIPQSIIEKAPSAELKPGQKDQDELPEYDQLDQIIVMTIEEAKGIEEIVAAGFERVMVEDVLRRIRINEYKRKQAALGLKVRPRAFGIGRRYPNVQNFRG
ncbi:NAD+ synthase [Desulforhopalus vacuolatus]|uniref:NAD+ synthase n=1 Tax=Desulforhopalus vacuolatus TaxID=40414 RepID=UPI001963370A|nr:NAD+ synthase [Desulforhopalus vacuolatus]MBM9520633.1 NAD+ synthase [Desulforhopalus vacuolatus]